MKCFLSVFIERFGKWSYCRSNLITMPSLRDIDFCTKLRKNPQDLRNVFQEEIEQFKKDYETEFRDWEMHHPGKQNNGKIYANYITEANGHSFIATVPIMYHGDELVPLNEAIEHIFYYLQDDKCFERLCKEKGYLLMESMDAFEYDLATDYLRNPGEEPLKREVINSLIHRIKHMDDERQYLYLRSLMNLCHLKEHEIYLQTGKIGRISSEMPSGDISLESKPSSYGSDFYYDKLIDDENYEELYNLYSLEEIEKRKRGK